MRNKNILQYIIYYSLPSYCGMKTRQLNRMKHSWDLGNYGEITVQNCISKLFATILKDGIYQYMDSYNKSKECKSRFIKNRQTNDNMFYSDTSLRENILKIHKVYSDFVEYERAVHVARFVYNVCTIRKSRC